MTDVLTAPCSPPDTAQQHPDDSYDDVIEMFVQLRRLPAESHEYHRQRERIVARCLPLADHVA
ncbi:MAG: RNA polymerase sigma factor SigF, partial [Mycobacterium sp.]|nr:RNA polymerase sigma factor SigF [Mycobacterium sp.]